ncbi:MAG: hypothetical protein WBD33_03255 [Xanthobacteraceae bacterium]
MKSTALLTLFLITVSYPAMARHHHADRNHTPSEQSHFSCDMVRAYVAQVGLAQAKAMAETAGATEADKRRALQCLEKKV